MHRNRHTLRPSYHSPPSNGTAESTQYFKNQGQWDRFFKKMIGKVAAGFRLYSTSDYAPTRDIVINLAEQRREYALSHNHKNAGSYGQARESTDGYTKTEYWPGSNTRWDKPIQPILSYFDTHFPPGFEAGQSLTGTDREIAETDTVRISIEFPVINKFSLTYVHMENDGRAERKACLYQTKMGTLASPENCPDTRHEVLIVTENLSAQSEFIPDGFSVRTSYHKISILADDAGSPTSTHYTIVYDNLYYLEKLLLMTEKFMGRSTYEQVVFIAYMLVSTCPYASGNKAIAEMLLYGYQQYAQQLAELPKDEEIHLPLPSDWDWQIMFRTLADFKDLLQTGEMKPSPMDGADPILSTGGGGGTKHQSKVLDQSILTTKTRKKGNSVCNRICVIS